MKDPHFWACSYKISSYFLSATILVVVASALLLISFCCPYWLESYNENYSGFVRLGLWDVCFRNYKDPNYQFDGIFDGCHGIFSHKYQNLRKWLQPGWLVFVQALMSSGVIFSIISFILVFLLIMHFLMPMKVFILAVVFVLESLSALTVFLAVSVFGGMCFDRSWIQYPNHNHLSWSFGLAVVSFILHASVAGLVLAETFHIRKHIYHNNVGQEIQMHDR